MLQFCSPGGVIRVARRIYVSNLTWRTSWQDLKDHFKQAGNGKDSGLPSFTLSNRNHVVHVQHYWGSGHRRESQKVW